MGNHAAERNRLLDSKRLRQLLKAIPFRTIADYREVGQSVSQKGRGSAQREIARLIGNQVSDENQFQFAVSLRTSRSASAEGPRKSVLRHKEQLLAISRKLGISLR